jgi:hypothetical protein
MNKELAHAQLSRSMRETHSLCDEAGDPATASLLEKRHG